MKPVSNLDAGLALAMALPACADSKLCGKFADAFDHANKSLAMSYVNGLGDDSAPRAASRYLEDVRDYLKQLILIQQMNAYDCNLPTTVSGAGAYLGDALDCRGAQTRGDHDSGACDLSTWKGD